MMSNDRVSLEIDGVSRCWQESIRKRGKLEIVMRLIILCSRKWSLVTVRIRTNQSAQPLEDHLYAQLVLLRSFAISPADYILRRLSWHGTSNGIQAYFVSRGGVYEVIASFALLTVSDGGLAGRASACVAGVLSAKDRTRHSDSHHEMWWLKIHYYCRGICPNTHACR